MSQCRNHNNMQIYFLSEGNKDVIYQNWQNTAKDVFKGKFIVCSSYVRKRRKTENQHSKLSPHEIKKEYQIKPKGYERKEGIREEAKEIENKYTIKKVSKPKEGLKKFFKTIQIVTHSNQANKNKGNTKNQY